MGKFMRHLGNGFFAVIFNHGDCGSFMVFKILGFQKINRNLYSNSVGFPMDDIQIISWINVLRVRNFIAF
jgi:hypothetical protein